MTRVRRLGAVVLGLALAGSFSVGCSGDPEPIPPETSAAEPSESPTASPSESESPEPWQEKTDAGAEAFVRHWIDEFNAARASSDTDALTALGTPACESCTNIADRIAQLKADDAVYRSGDWVIQSVTPTVLVGEGAPQIAVRVRQLPEEIEYPNGDIEKYPGGRITTTATLAWSSDGWRMDRLDINQ